MLYDAADVQNTAELHLVSFESACIDSVETVVDQRFPAESADEVVHEVIFNRTPSAMNSAHWISTVETRTE
eukprot:1418149-Pleurochrysis_carterae.AAC.1